MDHRGNGQRTVLVEDTATSSDHNPFSTATLGNSLLRSQQVKLLYSKFGPHYANRCKLVPLPPLSQTASMAMDGEQQQQQKEPKAVPDCSCGKVSLAQGAWLQL